MAQIRPFKGVRYSPSGSGDMAALISPPYDIISPQQQEALYQASPYNFVRIEFNRELPQDSAEDNRYTRAAAFLTNWQKEGILKQDETAACYLHVHAFSCGGRRYLRQDIIAAVKLEEWDSRIIRPHENIIPRAKSDRMSMLYACRCNTSPILAMYADPQKVISGLIAAQKKETPIMDFVDAWGEGHQVWAVNRPEVIRKLQNELAAQPLYIADGHHRYDSALTLKREKSAQNPPSGGEEGWNYVMASLMDMADPGLIILPTHRLVRGIAGGQLSGLKSRLEAFFDIQEISLHSAEVWSRIDRSLSGLNPDAQQVSLAVIGLTENQVTLLTLKNISAVSNLMPAFHSELYKKLDVSLLDHIILENLLGYNKDKEDILLAYTHDRSDALRRVSNQEYQMAFLLNPVGPAIVKGIADAGDRMPRKSTYFYPKAPAGLVFYKW